MGYRATWAGSIFGGLALMLAACSATPATPTLILPSPVLDTPPAIPTLTPSLNAVMPTVQAACTNAARFVEDLTIPDRTHVGPESVLDKRWSVQNAGTCDWGPDYRLVRQGSSGIQGPTEIALYPARAGAQAVWQVSLQAPSQQGEYQSRWQAQAPDGTLFGDEVFVIIVIDRPAATPTP